MTFVEAFRAGDTVMYHLDGISWWEAPIPKRWHRCKAQTKGSYKGGHVERCACGAVRGVTRYWFNRNSRKS